MSPRRAALVGLIFLGIAAVFYLVPRLSGGIIDYAGLTMLLALSAAMSIMAFVLFSGSRS
jgi:hypothetical protein